MVVAEKPSFQRGKYRSSLYVGKKGCMCNHAHECFSAHTCHTHTHTIKMLAPGGPIASTFYCICATGNYLNLLQWSCIALSCFRLCRGGGSVRDEIRKNLLSLYYTATPYLKVESNFLHMPKHVFEFFPFFFAESFIPHSWKGKQNNSADNEKLSQYDWEKKFKTLKMEHNDLTFLSIHWHHIQYHV